MYVRIRIAGLGGQGIKLCGVMLGHVAVESGFDAIVTTQYTPATRGGPIDSSLTISDAEKIRSPFFEKPDILCVLARKSWELHKRRVNPTTTVIYDSDLIPTDLIDHSTETIRTFPFTSVAIKNKIPVNMLLIGVLAYKLGLGIEEVEIIINDYSFQDMKNQALHILRIDPLAFEQTISRHSPARFRKNNLKALKLGYNIAEAYPRLRF
ncbi:MAG: 2-oxoacid:acceptor oxidoreductase family protein [Candidatus Hodarchaeales archaeon]|jgi:2-oxoglutarate ferredoxin oxidoreductase subunit gamma